MKILVWQKWNSEAPLIVVAGEVLRKPRRLGGEGDGLLAYLVRGVPEGIREKFNEKLNKKKYVGRIVYDMIPSEEGYVADASKDIEQFTTTGVPAGGLGVTRQEIIRI